MRNKYQILFLSVVIDILGVITSSWVIPFLGDIADVFWAPLSAYAMTRLYKGTEGKVAGVVTFIEEAIPGLDIIPSFTLMWIYKYLIQGKSVENVLPNQKA